MGDAISTVVGALLSYFLKIHSAALTRSFVHFVLCMRIGPYTVSISQEGVYHKDKADGEKTK